MPPRKRQRPNPTLLSSLSLPTTALSPETSLSRASSTSAQQASDQKKPPQPESNSERKSSDASQRVKETNSWYASWSKPPKATASTSVARENILGGTVRTRNAPDFSRFEAKRSEDDASMPDDADPVLPPPTIATNTSNTSSTSNTDKKSDANKSVVSLRTGDKKPLDTGRPQEIPSPPETKPPPEQQQKASDNTKAQEQRPELEAPADKDDQTHDASQKQVPSAGWFGGWWAKPAPVEPAAKPIPGSQETKEEAMKPAETIEPAEAAPPPEQAPASEPPATEEAAEAPQAASWFGYWYSTPQPKANASKINLNEDPKAKAGDVPTPDVSQPEPVAAQSTPPKAGSTWAFWSRDSPKIKSKTSLPESGQIAVMGEGSEVQPLPMAERRISESATKDPKDNTPPTEPPAGVLSWRRSKRIRPISMDLESVRPPSADSAKSAPVDRLSTTPHSQVGPEQELPPSKPLARTDSKKKKPVPVSKKSTAESEPIAKEPPNVLLPSFSSTYQMKENPSILRQITNLVLRTSQPPPNHVFRVNDPPKIRKAVAIGVHGFFPASYLRPMIGQPTGTSLRFVGLCADAIRKWAESHGCSDCEIEKVALEGEGRINDRVANLWKLLLNWIEHIRQADLVVIACHSQGVPVSIMLLEKLIDLGVLTDTKIGVCAMAGVALGPFPDYKSSILMGSAAELWEFGDPQSNNSQRFEACLKRVVDFGARITFVGSIDDQLSAVYSPANHPYIYRAVFIDGRVHAPDFISHLIGFALKLRNLGISDHGLIRELSVALAGSLYSGEGHSRLYFDSAVYDLAITHALETTNTAQPTPCLIPKRDTTPLASSNPYVLPWIMRGLLEEDFVKTQLSAETEELLRQFDDWKPTNKALKDVKYRLEAVRSKL
ncbi:uncharacterized protein TRIVIDRAFT_123323 [Trichoderma virens Gv29-8]